MKYFLDYLKYLCWPMSNPVSAGHRSLTVIHFQKALRFYHQIPLSYTLATKRHFFCKVELYNKYCHIFGFSYLYIFVNVRQFQQAFFLVIYKKIRGGGPIGKGDGQGFFQGAVHFSHSRHYKFLWSRFLRYPKTLLG